MSISRSTASPNAIVSNIKTAAGKGTPPPPGHNPAVTGCPSRQSTTSCVTQSDTGLLASDIEMAGLDAGMVLGPFYCELDDPSAHARTVPDYSVFGIAAASGILSKQERVVGLSEVSDR